MRAAILVWVLTYVISCVEPKVVEVDSTELQNHLEQPVRHNIRIDGDQFILDGQKLHIVSGSVHYFRLPAAFWRDRLQKLKAAGLNSVATYVEWSYHEPEKRQYDFDGDRDVAAFVKTAAEVGLHVLLRPGPYICAERDLGGLPYWLLGKYPNIKLRTTDKDFIAESSIWMDKLFEQLKPLLFANGGPIILVQVENEYGSYGSDKPYKLAMRDIILKHVRDEALLYTTDGTSATMVLGGAVPGALTTIDFGAQQPNNVMRQFIPLRAYMPEGPLMNSEFYPGWLTHWGETIQTVPSENVVTTFKEMLDNSINVNFYVFYGGTNFEFTAGANYFGRYTSDITSYDYDAPLTEAGDPTPKYYAIRDVMEKYNPELKNIAIPVPSKKGNYGIVNVQPILSLLSSSGRSSLGTRYADVNGEYLPTFEALRQRAGLVLYETLISKGGSLNLLHVKSPRDLIYVYVNNVFQGVLARTTSILSLPVTVTEDNSVLSLLVENCGRINYGSQIHDYKGILSAVTINNVTLDGKWNVTGFPLENLESLPSAESKITNHPIIYTGSFQLPGDEKPLDTFLDTTGWDKGYVWINGHNLGRYWPTMGPQITLYVPSVWLLPAPAQNNLTILELGGAPSFLTMQFIDYPILNRTAAYV